MTLIQKIQLAGEQNNFDVFVTGDKRKFKYWNVKAHTRNRELPYKAISGDDKIFSQLCTHLIQQRKGTEGYKYISHIAGVSSKCEFIDGGFTYVISTYGRGDMILVYKNN